MSSTTLNTGFIGTSRLRRMRNPHRPDEGTSPTGLEVSGILGSATLSQLVMEIDYRDNLVHFTFDLSKGFH